MPLQTDVLAFLKQTPAPIKVCLFALFFLDLILKFCSKINWSDFILLLTLIVVILYTYYTYKLARISMISPSLLAARQEHSMNLKKFLESWLNGSLNGSYESYINFSNSKYNTSNRFKEMIKSNWMYKDILEYHVHVNDREKIRELCDKIEQTIDAYNKSRNDLIKTIEQRLYAQQDIVNEINGSSTNERYKLAKYIYEYYARRSSDIGMRDSKIEPVYLSVITKFCDNDDFRFIYDEILKIQKLNMELTKQNQEIIDMLSPLLKYPILPGKNCSILKPLWEDDMTDY